MFFYRCTAEIEMHSEAGEQHSLKWSDGTWKDMLASFDISEANTQTSKSSIFFQVIQSPFKDLVWERKREKKNIWNVQAGRTMPLLPLEGGDL